MLTDSPELARARASSGELGRAQNRCSRTSSGELGRARASKIDAHGRARPSSLELVREQLFYSPSSPELARARP
eukprot:NODE_2437_length_788_cov_3.607578_g1313_i2.p2 GENE.NODE_2437_length_788_cov_3.607578_g1313_i2~~NODE_2437_length_788_cov_3.607578_g1313_i2.p2  ORF type:complete len:74 (-),score=3.67 NODE_2437_length_788_cov_3.607578_g1313_i2:502-723(-)